MTRSTAGARVSKRPHWALARLFMVDPATGLSVINAAEFGRVSGPPPASFVCEPCTPGVYPDYPTKATTEEMRRIQAQRFCLCPLYRHCQRCQRVTVHFPMQGKAPGK